MYITFYHLVIYNVDKPIYTLLTTIQLYMYLFTACTQGHSTAHKCANQRKWFLVVWMAWTKSALTFTICNSFPRRDEISPTESFLTMLTTSSRIRWLKVRRLYQIRSCSALLTPLMDSRRIGTPCTYSFASHIS